MSIELTFIDANIRELCERGGVAEKLLGGKSARRLRARLADIQACENITDVTVGWPMPMGNGAAQFAFWLSEGDRLVLEPMNRPIPKNGDGGVDWVKVSKVRVVYVGKNND